jgi:hypothetical protein
MCVCTSQKSFFRRQTFALQHKSGGRKPPVGNKTPLQGTTAHLRRLARVHPGAAGVSQPWYGKRMCGPKRNQSAKTNRRCKRESEPRRADARRSCSDARLCVEKIVFRRKTFALQHKSGGRKPPVVLETRSQRLDRNCRAEATGRWSVHEHRCNCITIPRRADTRRSCSDARSLPNSAGFSPHDVRITHHGGLTPAALGRMCVCASQKSFFAGRRSHCSTRAGGVSPPWFWKHARSG